MSEPYKEVYLDYRGRAYTITPQAYEQINAIIQASLICQFCYKGYTTKNPQVAENVCLSCYLVQKKDNLPKGFHFVGEVLYKDSLKRSYKTYKFVDARGYVYLIHNNGTVKDSINEDITATLEHHGFRIPKTYTLKDGRTVKLDYTEKGWRKIYGDFTTSPVVLVTYKEYYGNKIETAFLLYLDREPLEFSKRKNPMRLWYNEAKAEIEATYKPHQGYIVGTGADEEDKTAFQLYEHHMYPGVVGRARQAYDKEKASTLS